MLANPDYNAAKAITPSDTVNIVCPAGRVLTDAIYVGTKGATGTIVAVMGTGDTATFVGLVPGTIYPIMASRVNATTTDASNLVGLWSV